MYDLTSFWSERLAGAQSPDVSRLEGWSGAPDISGAFIEPALVLREGEPETADIFIVAAAGAVGKTTLAHRLAAKCNYALVDLARASQLGGNFFKGGIANAFGNRALSDAADGRIGLVVDSLDEAQLRAGWDGFTAGLLDLAGLVAEPKALPAVLFGRSLAAEDAWLILSYAGHKPCILEIDFFDEARASRYVIARLEGLAAAEAELGSAYGSHPEKFQELALGARGRLAGVDIPGQRRFTGYAPVLDALCRFSLDKQNLNPQSRIGELDGGTPTELVRSIGVAILEREQGKLVNQLRQSIHSDQRESLEALYGPDEQRALLCSRMFGGPAPRLGELRNPKLSEAYREMVETFLGSHPFKSGVWAPANQVFAADLLVWALSRPEYAVSAKQRLRRDPSLNSGLVFDLYAERLKRGHSLPLSQVGLLYDALRARVSARQRVGFDLIGDDIGLEVAFEVLSRPEPDAAARGGVSLPSPYSDERFGPYKVLDDGELELVSPLSNIEVDAPIWATIGDGKSLSGHAPTHVAVQSLTINATHVFVSADATRADEASAHVLMTAEETDAGRVSSLTVNAAKLSVTWPDAQSYPWTDYAREPAPEDEEGLSFLQHRLRKMLTAFRAGHGRELARYAKKLEHGRMVKNETGVFLLKCLEEDGILTPFSAGAFYALDAARLSELVGMTYFELQSHDFSERGNAYLRSVLERMEPRAVE